MNIQTLITLISFAVLLFIAFLVIYIKRKEIASFIWPSAWVEIEMLQLDNSISTWLEKKNDDLKFEFHKGYYNMFHQAVDEKGNIIKQASVYRSGRLAKFFYHEGFNDPIDFRQGKISGNPQINKQLQTLEISELFDEDNNFGWEFLKKYGIFLLIAIILLLLWLAFRQPETIQQTAQVITQNG